MNKSINFSASLKDALGVGFIAIIIFSFITGIRLKGYSFETNFSTVAVIVGAIFFGRLLLNILHQTETAGNFLKKYLSQKNLGVLVETKKNTTAQLYWTALIALLLVIALPFFLSKYFIVVLVQCMIYVLLGLGLNIVVGWAGMLDLGFVAFYAVGAYSLGLLHHYFALGFWEILPLAALISAMTGVVLGFPVLRMHGDYLAIVTLGFGEIIRLVLNNWVDFTGGPNGMSTAKITFFGIEFKNAPTDLNFHTVFGLKYSPVDQMIFLYIVLLLVCVLAAWFCVKLKKMPIGRAWEALRENEIACRSMGINHVSVKLTAFMLGAMFGGIGGVFFGAYQGFINPTSFTFIESALIIAIVVLGGLGSIPGVIIAAIFLNILPEVFREFENMRVIIFGLVMVTMMIWRPRGLIRITRPRF